MRPDPSTLRAVLAASSNPIDRYDLLLSHLIDEVTGAGMDLSGLVLRRSTNGEFTIPPSIVADLTTLAHTAALSPLVALNVANLAALAARVVATPTTPPSPAAAIPPPTQTRRTSSQPPRKRKPQRLPQGAA